MFVAEKGLVILTSSLIEEFIQSEDVGVVKSRSNQEIEVVFVGLGKVIVLNVDQVSFLNPKEYGDMFEEKICNICHKIRRTSEFDLNQNGKGDRPVRRPSCKVCRKKIDGIGISSLDRKKWNKIKPEYVDFECPICRKITIPPITSKVVLDHDHATGVPTGWICDSCNTGLGRFKDDVHILRNAIDYLENTKTSNEARE
jgi:hypothetical protein